MSAQDALAAPVDTRALRQALGAFATGVTIITCRPAGAPPAGLTANSFASLSLEPPLVLWALQCHGPSQPAFEAAGHFAVSVLRQDQVDFSNRFASSEPDKFTFGAWRDGLGGCPVLDDALAVFECEIVARQPAGDHLLFIGRVERFRQQPGEPLLYFGGRYRALAA